jgi:hypothetical protein
MDYSKSGGPKSGRREPRPVYHHNAGGKAGAKSGQNEKAQLLARMKATAQARAGKGDGANPDSEES